MVQAENVWDMFHITSLQHKKQRRQQALKCVKCRFGFEKKSISDPPVVSAISPSVSGAGWLLTLLAPGG